MSEDAAKYGGIKILAARKYKGDVVKVVWGAKYSGKPRNGFLDAEEAVKEFAEYERGLADRELVVPVPGRLKGKTYALAPRLARTVAEVLGIPGADVLERTREAPPMRRMSREKRKQHVQGLYRVARPAKIKGRRVLVVDDVSTTGATLNECGRLLLAAGAADVMGLVLATVEKKRGKAMAKKKEKKKGTPAPSEAATRQIIRVKLPEGEESSARSSRALAAAKAKARRVSRHPSVEGAFAWWPRLSFGQREEHEPVEIVVDVYATSEAEAKRIVAYASFIGAGRGGRRRR